MLRLILKTEEVAEILADQFEGDESKPMLQIDRRRGALQDKRYQFWVFDPRILGMTTESYVVYHVTKIDDFVGRKNRTALRATQERLRDELDTWKIEYDTTSGAYKMAVRYWAAPAQGWGVVRVQSVIDFKGDTITNTVDSALRFFPKGGVWFPETMTRETTHSDVSKSPRRERVVVTEARVNEDPDPALFEIASLGVGAGWPVHILSDGTNGKVTVREGHWDGTQFAANTSSPAAGGARGKLIAERGSTRRGVVLWISVNAAILAAIVWLLYRRSRRA